MGNSNKTTTGSSAPKRSATTKGKLSTAAVGKQLGVRVTADRIKALGIVPAIETGRGAYWHPEQVSEIAIALACDLVDEYIENHQQQHAPDPAAPVQCAEDDPEAVLGALLGHSLLIERHSDGTVEAFPGPQNSCQGGKLLREALDTWRAQFAGARFADVASVMCTLVECYVERREDYREQYRKDLAEIEHQAARPWWQRLFHRAAA